MVAPNPRTRLKEKRGARYSVGYPRADLVRTPRQPTPRESCHRVEEQVTAPALSVSLLNECEPVGDCSFNDCRNHQQENSSGKKYYDITPKFLFYWYTSYARKEPPYRTKACIPKAGYLGFQTDRAVEFVSLLVPKTEP